MKDKKDFNIKLMFFSMVLLLAIMWALFSLNSFPGKVQGKYEKARVIIGGQEIAVELAVNEAEKNLGLGKRKTISENQGMLFVYDGYYLPKFWMKDMFFPIDIIWLKDNLIVGYEQNVPLPVGESLPLYQPQSFVNYVLEVKAGFIEKNGIKIGDYISVLD